VKERNDWLLSRARSSIEQSTSLSRTLAAQITPDDLKGVMQEVSAWAAHAKADKIAVFMRYLASGLDVEAPPAETIRVYMQQLRLLDSCLDELAARILRTYKYKSFPPIEFIHSTQDALPVYQRVRRLQMLGDKMQRSLVPSTASRLSKQDGIKKFREIIENMTPDHSAPPRPE
jgi:hypothetical protein